MIFIKLKRVFRKLYLYNSAFESIYLLSSRQQLITSIY